MPVKGRSSIASTLAEDPLRAHFVALEAGLTAGRVVPFMGAGVNAYSRPDDAAWSPGCGFLPFASELAAYLAARFEYPSEDVELALVAEYVSIRAGRQTLYDELHRVFDVDLEPTSIHRSFARMPGLLREKGYTASTLVVVTTNYDDVMERAFRQAGEDFDVIWYLADRRPGGKVIHRTVYGEQVIENVKEYLDLDPTRSLVLKMHGSIDRVGREHRDSYVITVDDYLEYLMHSDVNRLLPRDLVLRLRRSQFIFLGYGLRDWNMAALLYRMWGEREIETKSWWAVPHIVDKVEAMLWSKRNVELIAADLGLYAAAVDEHMSALPSRS